MRDIKAKGYYTEQFRRIQEQTGMSPFTLRFLPEYEKAYRSITQARSVKRVRYCFLIGLISLGGFFAGEALGGAWDTENELLLYILCFGIAIPVILLGILLTYTKWAVQHMEKITFIVFLISGIVLIVKKPIEQTEGPILPLFILLVPVFGITRMRFTKSLLLGWLLFFVYLIVQLSAAADDRKSIIYQAVNYGISIIGGMVSQYRQELLRRRNFSLGLPFSGIDDDTVHKELQTSKFSKQSLMYGWSRSFRNPQVEETFYRYWYLIDPFPFEPPNAGVLHQNVYRVVRFAIMGLVLNQAVLGIQDSRFLDNDQHMIAAILRYAVVVPVYLSAGIVMYCFGRAFYQRWLREAEAHARAITPDGQPIAKEVVMDMPLLGDSQVPKKRSSTTSSNTSSGSSHPQGFFGRVIEKGGYVRYAQIYASLVVMVHVLAMGALLLVVSTGDGTKPVYYMGLLNGILFAHRSGFRVRFIYATHTTAFAIMVFIIATYFTRREQFAEYSSYVIVVLVLAMMISYEEESLRRSFFVLKSIRMLEFDEWFSTVLRIQGWVKKKLQRKVLEAKGKLQGLTKEETEEIALKEVQGQMGQASRYGVMTQAANILLGAVTELV